MREALGQAVLIENVAGAGGTLAVGRVARAAPDGYTICIGNISTHVFTGAMYALRYHVADDFEPISLLTRGPHVLVARRDFPAQNLNELISWLKSNPDKATAGTAGAGSSLHLFAVLFQNVTGTRFPFAHYRGVPQAIQDLVAGQIDLMDSDVSTAMPQIRAGTIKAYAVMAKHRMAMAPEIPTTDEAGLPDFHNSVWTGLWAPRGTPHEIVAKLNAAAVYALAHPSFRQRAADNGAEIFPREQQTPEALGMLQRAEITKWWPIIKAANLKGE
jgi:tripartite-type tricarboxylate transporter receptor subunit TctC